MDAFLSLLVLNYPGGYREDCFGAQRQSHHHQKTNNNPFLSLLMQPCPCQKESLDNQEAEPPSASPASAAGLLTMIITESPRRNIFLTYRSLFTADPLD